MEILNTKGLYDVVIESPKGEEKLKLYVHQEESGAYIADLSKGYAVVSSYKSEFEPGKEELENLIESYCFHELGLTDNYQWRATKRRSDIVLERKQEQDLGRGR